MARWAKEVGKRDPSRFEEDRDRGAGLYSFWQAEAAAAKQAGRMVG